VLSAPTVLFGPPVDSVKSWLWAESQPVTHIRLKNDTLQSLPYLLTCLPIGEIKLFTLLGVLPFFRIQDPITSESSSFFTDLLKIRPSRSAPLTTSKNEFFFHPLKTPPRTLTPPAAFLPLRRSFFSPP